MSSVAERVSVVMRSVPDWARMGRDEGRAADTDDGRHRRGERRGGTRPNLEVLEHVSWWRRVSWAEVAAAAVLVVVLFSALMLHVSMIGAQERLDEVQAQVQQARLEQEQLRRAESQLTSPGKVLAIAGNELGMVEAAPPEFVQVLPRFIRPFVLLAPPASPTDGTPGSDTIDPTR